MKQDNETNDEPGFLLSQGRPRIGKPGVTLLLIVGLVLVLIIALQASRRDQLDVYLPIDKLPIEDEVLRSCVISTAERYGWQDAGHFTHLRCTTPTGSGIRSLEGIEHLPELTDLNLSFNKIRDAAPLENLPRLEVLDVSHNELRSLPALRSSPYLVHLALNHNQLVDLDWMEGEVFPALHDLSIANNHVEDVSRLATIEALRELSLRNNSISNIDSLAALKGLQALDLGENNLDDISGLGELTMLNSLFLDGNRITDIRGLSTLSMLAELNLAANPLEDTAPIRELMSMQRLNLQRTGLETVADLLALGDLEVLRLSGNPRLTCEQIAQLQRLYGDAVLTDLECPPAPAE